VSAAECDVNSFSSVLNFICWALTLGEEDFLYVTENTVFTTVLHRNRWRQWKSGARFVTKKYMVFVGK
jgi:hypothetical protein